ncbi:hypothetical protein ABK040_002769 [Willaertia magna]
MYNYVLRGVIDLEYNLDNIFFLQHNLILPSSSTLNRHFHIKNYHHGDQLEDKENFDLIYITINSYTNNENIISRIFQIDTIDICSLINLNVSTGRISQIFKVQCVLLNYNNNKKRKYNIDQTNTIRQIYHQFKNNINTTTIYNQQNTTTINIPIFNTPVISNNLPIIIQKNLPLIPNASLQFIKTNQSYFNVKYSLSVFFIKQQIEITIIGLSHILKTAKSIKVFIQTTWKDNMKNELNYYSEISDYELVFTIDNNYLLKVISPSTTSKKLLKKSVVLVVDNIGKVISPQFMSYTRKTASLKKLSDFNEIISSFQQTD